MCLTVKIPLPAVAVVLLTGLATSSSPVMSQSSAQLHITGLFEPSGAVQLNDKQLLVVEDEPSDPFVLLTYLVGSDTFSAQSLLPEKSTRTASIQLSDLEAVTADAEGSIYAITSHSRKANGKRQASREKLIRLTVSDDQLSSASVRTDFRNQLIRAYPMLRQAAKERNVKDNGGLNIEGLTFDANHSTLWVGLRAPLSQDKAILISILNPRAALTEQVPFQFSKLPVLLDLKGGGIRDIVYDKVLKGYLILSQRESGKRQKKFRLWFWKGDPKESPRKIHLEGVKKLKRTESITPVTLNGVNRLLLLNDDGNRQKSEIASYLLLDYAQLDILP